ncbi:MAG: hypothetical protein SNJ67_11245 [Chloracidobacterium sp.]|uniref:Glycosyltransferase RgtA/B/C/D-like domain-containing protein n=1 Tax=Chloracidobacterium validum TaxID=2821543 RepID=A0ABX8BBN6_9BACT|nr:hypothetical protein [Chloracidobacterium validum]QUW02945.1 hypothetical protein J8C06_00385 [Chloracidobacterium validum]
MTNHEPLAAGGAIPTSETVGLLRHPLMWILIAYAALGLSLLSVYQFQINPDGIAYLDIAEKYARGDFWGAINAYWSPLLSWLVVPWRWVGVPPQIAVKLVLLGSGGLALCGIWRLLDDAPLVTRVMATAGAMPLTAYHALSVITPDLLVAAVLLWYLAWLVDEWTDGWKLVWGGCLGVLSYVAKAFAFPFFVAHLLCGWRLAFARATPGYERFRSLAITLGTFGVLSSAWIVALYMKYGVWMIGSTGRYNYALAGPRMRFVHSMETSFFPPAEAGDTSAWTDPTRLPIKAWSPFESLEYAQYQVAMTFDRLRVMAFDHALDFSPCALLLLIGLLVGLRLSPLLHGERIKIVVFGLVVYASGYALIYVEARHLLPIAYWLIVASVWLILAIGANWKHVTPRLQAVLVGLVMISFAWRPAQALVQGALGQDAGLQVCQGLYRAAQALKVQLGVGGRIASNQEWHRSLYLTYFLGGRYYGVAPEGASPEAVAEALNTYNVDYYFVWADAPGRFPEVSWGEEITGGQDAWLRIYQARPGSSNIH